MARTVQLKGKLSWNNAEFRKGAKEANSIATKMGKTIALAGTAAATAFGAAMAKIAMDASRHFDRVAKASRNFQISTKFMQNMARAAEKGGFSLEQFAKSQRRLITSTADAQKGIKTYVDAFSDLNININDFVKLSPEEKFLRIARAVRDIGDDQSGAAAVMKLMGQGASEMLGAMREYHSLATDLKNNRVLSDADLKAIEKANDAWTDIKFELLFIAGKALPKVIEAIETIKSKSDEIREIWRGIASYMEWSGFGLLNKAGEAIGTRIGEALEKGDRERAANAPFTSGPRGIGQTARRAKAAVMNKTSPPTSRPVGGGVVASPGGGGVGVGSGGGGGGVGGYEPFGPPPHYAQGRIGNPLGKTRTLQGEGRAVANETRARHIREMQAAINKSGAGTRSSGRTFLQAGGLGPSSRKFGEAGGLGPSNRGFMEAGAFLGYSPDRALAGRQDLGVQGPKAINSISGAERRRMREAQEAQAAKENAGKGTLVETNSILEEINTKLD